MQASTSAGDAERQLAAFIRKFSPIDQRLIRAVRTALRKRFPTANELVYDNYNFFVIGYSPTERPSDAIVSMAARANGVGLFFSTARCVQLGPDRVGPRNSRGAALLWPIGFKKYLTAFRRLTWAESRCLQGWSCRSHTRAQRALGGQRRGHRCLGVNTPPRRERTASAIDDVRKVYEE